MAAKKVFLAMLAALIVNDLVLITLGAILGFSQTYNP
jgi:hypothetical protein